MIEKRFQQTTEDLLVAYEQRGEHPTVQVIGAEEAYVSLHCPKQPIVYDVHTPITYTLGDAYPVAFEQAIEDKLKESDRPINEQMHLVIYMIGAPAARITAVDLRTVRKIEQRGIPVLVVITKADEVEPVIVTQFREALGKENIPYAAVTQDPGTHVSVYRWLNAHCEEGLKHAIRTSQLYDLQQTKTELESSIRRHVAAAFAVGFTPIPFADGPILIANQAKMISKILGEYDLGSLSEHVQSLLAALGVGELISQFGRYIVAQIVKFVPGVGTVAGGMINGTVASTVTVSLGLTVSEMAYQAAKEKIEHPDRSIDEFFKDTFTKETFQTMFAKQFESESANVQKPKKKWFSRQKEE